MVVTRLRERQDNPVNVLAEKLVVHAHSRNL